MRISRIQIQSFRNFHRFDVNLSDHAVIVGENKIGKSNLLHAIRLVLDPTLPDSARQLRDEDFWDGLPRPLTQTDRIVIAVDLADFENNANQLAVLAEHLIQPEPMVARLTYVFQPLPALAGNPTRESDYEFIVYGGDKPDNHVDHQVRRRIPIDILPALRDAESDLTNWRRSPLRPLLDEAGTKIDRHTLETMAEKISESTSAVGNIPEIKTLAERITERLRKMVGTSHAVEMLLGFSPTDPERILRALRVFIDDGRRGIGEASLGSANLLYLTLKSLELDQLVMENSRDHTFLAIEEPEAHLHPHIQRLVYRDFLRPRVHQVGAGDGGTAAAQLSVSTLLTTHSPHIVSVSPLRSLVVLRKSEDGRSTEGVSSANLEFDKGEVADLERYLDVTRGEMLFARGVLLVEGDAELFLLPVLGRLLGVDFDQAGITACSVSGTNFTPYVKLLGPKGLNIPLAVLTDFDPQPDRNALGEQRVVELLAFVLSHGEYKAKSKNQLLKLAPRNGIFLGDHTFEVDLFKCGRHKSMCDTLQKLTESEAAKKRAQEWMETPAKLDPDRFLDDIRAIGKGRFAQRLAARLTGELCPDYVKKAIEHVVERCR